MSANDRKPALSSPDDLPMRPPCAHTADGGDSGSCVPGPSCLAGAVGHLDASGASPGIVTAVLVVGTFASHARQLC